MNIDYAHIGDQLLSLLHNRNMGIDLGFNLHAAEQEDPAITYQGYLWSNDLERDKAIAMNRVWTARISGDDSGTLADASLAQVIGELLGDEIKALECRALDDELRRLLPNARTGLDLEFNRHAADREHPYYAYESYTWRSDEEQEQAIEANNVWTINIFGRGIDPSVSLAASSLEGLMQFLKGSRDVILKNQKRERSNRMSNRHIADMLMRSQRAPTFTVERVVRRGGRARFVRRDDE